MGSISKDEMRAEQLKQQQFVVRAEIADQQRVVDVGYPLLRAALPICGQGATSTRTGVYLANQYAFGNDYEATARSMGFSDTLSVIAVAKASGAERAGVVAGDRLIAIGDHPAPTGKGAVKDVAKDFERIRNADANYAFGLRHAPLGAWPSLGATGESVALTAPMPTLTSNDSVGASRINTTIPPDTVCDYGLVALKSSELNAFADGKNVYVTSAMLRFAASDDELAIVLGHEIAHNAMRHMDAKKRNAGLGALFGAVLDGLAASQGVYTGGSFSQDFAAMGAQVFSQSFESEADYVGLYVLARGGRPFANSPDFWRRMGTENPGSIKFATSHPTTAERFLRLERTSAEIKQKQLTGAPLIPETKK
jgi:hypothetical protein